MFHIIFTIIYYYTNLKLKIKFTINLNLIYEINSIKYLISI